MKESNKTADASAFAELGLDKALVEAVAAAGYETPSPIQARCIPPLLEGRDILGLAQTGTGKTAAFALPILQHITRKPKRPGNKRIRALVLTPTRELASQIRDSFVKYARNQRFSCAVVFGGVGYAPQTQKLAKGLDVLVATPGRLLDLCQRGDVYLDDIEIFVLDEADRMLDMGFAPDVRRVVAMLPQRRQSLLFSATMPDDIASIADSLLRDPVRVSIVPAATTAEKIDQFICHVEKVSKRELLLHVLGEHPDGKVLIFTRMKFGANKVADFLYANGIPAEAIHGNKSQSARERALANFRSGKMRVLVATDIAARGIDVKGIELVVNFDLPEEPEAYVHRIGRTARAGASGKAIAFCEPCEHGLLRAIERVTRQRIPIIPDHPFAARAPAPRPLIAIPVGHPAHPAAQAGRSPAPKRPFQPRTGNQPTTTQRPRGEQVRRHELQSRPSMDWGSQQQQESHQQGVGGQPRSNLRRGFRR